MEVAPKTRPPTVMDPTELSLGELYAQALQGTKDAEAIAVIEAEIAQLPKAGGQ